MSRLGDLIEILILFVLVFIVIPGIVPAALWYLLTPVTFWQKLAWFLVSLVVYIIELGAILTLLVS